MKTFLPPNYYIQTLIKTIKVLISVCTLGYFLLPTPLFEKPYSTVVYDSENNLLGARVAKDEQWRFPERNDVPAKFEACILQFEDKRFYAHSGVDPFAMARAMRYNLKHNKVVSGGSTLTMQVIRLSKNNPPRTYLQKLLELLLAVRLEFSYTKTEILGLYASHAPFGGNIVGLDAAAWKYYHLTPEELTWAQMATLAVLPNSPALIHPGRNRSTLLTKRNNLLKQLKQSKIITTSDYELFILEPLPQKPLPLPNKAPHLTEYLQQKTTINNEAIHTTIHPKTQQNTTDILKRHQSYLTENSIHNSAILVLEVSSGKVLAYNGNSDNAAAWKDVDMIHVERSSGSIIKPILYASAYHNGQINSTTLLPDMPSYFKGFTPKNYAYTYNGAVPARKALTASLNIPAVHLLSKHGVPQFLNRLKSLQFESIRHSSDHYGLSLILGGAEVKLSELCNAYRTLAHQLNYYNLEGKYPTLKNELKYVQTNEERLTSHTAEAPLFSSAAIYDMFNDLTAVVRPNEYQTNMQFESNQKIAWKTGTSFGFRDAWTVGITADYVVGVWVGNADGKGRPMLTGTLSAAPILFDVFNTLPNSNWFEQPQDTYESVQLCKTTGQQANRNCPTHILELPKAKHYNQRCIYHHKILLDTTINKRVYANCSNPRNVVQKTYFTLPPGQAYYYAQKHHNYKHIPPFSNNCQVDKRTAMQIIYPRADTKIRLPKNFDETTSPTILVVRHQNPIAKVFWSIDGQYLKSTTKTHELATVLSPGIHTLVVTDDLGNSLQRTFEITKK